MWLTWKYIASIKTTDRLFVCLRSYGWTEIQTERKLHSQWSYVICSLRLLCCLSCGGLLIGPAAHSIQFLCLSSCRTGTAMWRPPSSRTRTGGQTINSDASGVLVYVTSVFSDCAWWEQPETVWAHTRGETAANMLSWFASSSLPPSLPPSLCPSFSMHTHTINTHQCLSKCCCGSARCQL